ncbi:ceramide glucosyltransferase [Lophium mytilinum]|uniref:Ceramide glucosyltransferase n=1 Tax=Lophium mytilinum TaxID=390894 RepID=A0A6A6QX86_9PEZI|nr:ceramide glucosyltransferase [Lophium mytilinum]
MFLEAVAAVCLVWYALVIVPVCVIGYTQLYRWYSRPPPPAVCLTALPAEEIPHVTIIRPVKGLEPRLYECLAATFRQTYPRDKLTIFFCVSSRDDPGFPVLERLLRDFPGFEVTILVEQEDARLQNEHGDNDNGVGEHAQLGPNPKIRNMSRAYREAKGDIVWIIDCNVWVGKGVAGRMVDKLCGYGGKRRYKFVHQIPLVVDTASETADSETRGLLAPQLHDEGDGSLHVASTSTASTDLRNPTDSHSGLQHILQTGGGRLEELFMSSSHAKFYTAINTVLIAPCIVGKSNMFRRSHLAALTSSNPARAPGIDFFSDNICEDHLIGDALWKKPQPFELEAPPKGGKREKWGKHALVFGDIAFQPMSSMSVREYIARRVRWLRVRKFTVALATLVEPGTESILCSLYGAFAVKTLPFFRDWFGISPSWTSFWTFFALSVGVWATVDWTLYRRLHSAKSIELDSETPDFARPPRRARWGGTRRPFREWLAAWIGREVLAFPIWAWAIFGGVSVEWRGKRFWVGLDMKVHEIVEAGDKRRD